MRALLITLTLVGQLAWGAIQFEATTVSVKAGPEDESAEIDFKFSNTGDEQVIMSRIETNCDCLSVKVSGGTQLPDDRRRYKPGESGIVRGTFKTGNSTGTAEQVVAIWVEGDPKDKPSIQLVGKIEIPQLVLMEPKVLRWELGSELTTKRLTVTMDPKQPIKITGMDCSSKQFHAELKTLEEGKRYEVLVTPLDTKAPGIGVVQVDTDCSVEKQRRQQSFVMVQRPE